MDTTNLHSQITRFFETQKTDQLLIDHYQDHEERKQKVQTTLHLSRILSLTTDELKGLFEDTDAWYGVRGKQRFWKNLFGVENELIPNLRQNLMELVSSAEIGLDSYKINELIKKIPGIGPAFFSEILALRFPDKYWLLNGQIRKFFELQKIDLNDELPFGKKGDQGEEYLLAGKHLGDLRTMMGQILGQPVDFLMVDLFAYWVVKQGETSKNDPIDQRIREILETKVTPKRIEKRIQGEKFARELLTKKAGKFVEEDIRAFLKNLSSDFYNGIERYDRFMPGFYGRHVNDMISDIDSFNRWTELIWKTPDNKLESCLDEFWEKLEISGAGVSYPTAILYLKDPEKYGIWLPMISKGLQTATNFQPGSWRKSSSYHSYNSSLQSFRKKFNISPQLVDLVFYYLGRNEIEEKRIFEGFSTDAFQFLSELKENNTDEWMHKNGEENRIRYKNVVREPLRHFLIELSPKIKSLDPTFETEVKFGKVLGTIKKRWTDQEGPYYAYLWGAFYREGYTKQTDAQLFVGLHHEELSIGFSNAGNQGGNRVYQFIQNLRSNLDIFLKMLKGLPGDYILEYVLGENTITKEITEISTREDVEPLLESKHVEIFKRFEKDDAILLLPDLVAEGEQIFENLYPFFVFTTTEDQSRIPSLLGDEEGGDEIIDEPYSLSELYDETFMPDGFWEEVKKLIDDKGQIIFYGPPGTGKTFIARKFARYLQENANDPNGEFSVIQFHPSYTYEEFMEGIRPESVQDDTGKKNIEYPVKDGVFKQICDEAKLHQNRCYVLIIDEINRGEPSRIFGELLYALEYRDQTIKLPYSKRAFNIPANVFLIGTMNTADRSIALVDHALRRRFHFINLKPSPEILESWLLSTDLGSMDWLPKLLTLLNKKLELDSIDWNLHIGHSHFMKEDISEGKLNLIWKYDIIPTLEEYFYKNKSKISEYDLSQFKKELGIE